MEVAMKRILVIFLIAMVILFGVAIVKDAIIKGVVTLVASNVTGAPVHINGFSLGIFKHAIKIDGFKMYNPKGFPKGLLIDLPKIYVVYDLSDLFKGKIHLKDALIELKEMDLVKNKEGKLNTDSLTVAKKEPQGKPSKQMPLEIDTITLKLGRLISKDYSAGVQPVVTVYDLNINKTYKNITSAQQLAVLVLTEPMKSAGIQGAQIYGVSLLAGVAILPVAAATTLFGKDYAEEDFVTSIDRAYKVSLSVLKSTGNVKKEIISADAAGIEAAVNGVDVSVKIKKTTGRGVKVTVSARKFLLPKPEVAGGVLYQISGKLK
jgi:hypothetical protein